ncbi:MAG: hypothetical protein ACLGQH_05525 [Acidobacteriota bacterium]
MKSPNAAAAVNALPILDIHCPEHVARIGEAYCQERRAVLAALTKLETMGYAEPRQRERMVLATMEPMPGHELMARAPREVLKLRTALYLVSCHEHRRN